MVTIPLATGTVNLVVAIVAGAVVAALVLAFVLLVAVSALVVILQRSTMTSAPGLRRFVAWVARRSGHQGFRRADDRADPDEVRAGVDALRSRDPAFDPAAVCDAALRALFFTHVLSMTGDRRRLEQVATDDFWATPVARDALTRAEATGGARNLLNLDFQAGDVEVVDAVAGVGPLDRVTVRIGYRSQAVAQGPLVGRLQAMTRGSLAGTVSALKGPAATGHEVAQWELRGWYDWELVRPVGATTAERTDDRRCGTCGAPYHSDLDVECAACRTARSTPEGSWRTNRTWLLEA